jgi:hypothetical protein
MISSAVVVAVPRKPEADGVEVNGTLHISEVLA